jgi:voltage-gated potassium channel
MNGAFSYFTSPDIRARLGSFGVILLLITAGGTAGYMLIEGWRVVESLYMTVITLSTVGFSEVRPLSSTGRIFTTGLIVAGVGAVAYLFGTISQYIVSGELTGSLRRSRMQKSLDAMSDHYIICGFGRVGQQVLEDLQKEHKPCVVIEEDGALLEAMEEEFPHIGGDAADDEVLRRAGIERARGLVVVTGDDPTNLFVTLTAFTLNGKLSIVARANHPSTESKLLRAGATHVISPYRISGRRIATQLLYPSVADFLDVVMHSGDLELWLEQIDVHSDSDLHTKTVAEANVRQRTGSNILAVRRHAEGTILTNPAADMRFEPQDVVIALGTRAQLAALSKLAGEKDK